MRENEAYTEKMATGCVALMLDAFVYLTIIDEDAGGDVELIHALTVAVAKLSTPDMLKRISEHRA